MTENFDVNALKNPPEAGNEGAAANGNSSQQQAAAPPAGQPAPGAAPVTEEEKKNTPAAPTVESGQQPASQQSASSSPPASTPASGSATPPATPPATTLTAEQAQQLAITNMLKELGVGSIDDLKERLKPAVELTDAQKSQAQQAYESSLDAYSVKNSLMTRDEILELNNVAKASANDLVLAEFSKKYKETKPDAIPEEITQAFKIFYNTESTDETLKKYGAKEIEDRATQIRSVLESKRNEAKSAFDEYQLKHAKVPAFKQLIQTSLTEYVPEKLTLLGDGDTKVTFDIKPEEKQELEKFLVSTDTFNDFMKGGASQQMKESLKEKIEGFLYLKHRQKIYDTIYEAGKSSGTKQGSTTGATASFIDKSNGQSALPVNNNANDLTEADLQKLGTVFKTLQ